jgi:hypothetical protein
MDMRVDLLLLQAQILHLPVLFANRTRSWAISSSCALLCPSSVRVLALFPPFLRSVRPPASSCCFPQMGPSGTASATAPAASRRSCSLLPRQEGRRGGGDLGGAAGGTESQPMPSFVPLDLRVLYIPAVSHWRCRATGPSLASTAPGLRQAEKERHLPATLTDLVSGLHTKIRSEEYKRD